MRISTRWWHSFIILIIKVHIGQNIRGPKKHVCVLKGKKYPRARALAKSQDNLMEDYCKALITQTNEENLYFFGAWGSSKEKI